MYIDMHVYVYGYVCICVFVYVWFIHVCICLYMFVYVYTCLYIKTLCLKTSIQEYSYVDYIASHAHLEKEKTKFNKNPDIAT